LLNSNYQFGFFRFFPASSDHQALYEHKATVPHWWTLYLHYIYIYICELVLVCCEFLLLRSACCCGRPNPIEKSTSGSQLLSGFGGGTELRTIRVAPWW